MELKDYIIEAFEQKIDSLRTSVGLFEERVKDDYVRYFRYDAEEHYKASMLLKEYRNAHITYSIDGFSIEKIERSLRKKVESLKDEILGARLLKLSANQMVNVAALIDLDVFRSEIEFYENILDAIERQTHIPPTK